MPNYVQMPTDGNCITCGLPLTLNMHQHSGKPQYLNKVGAGYGCLSCAEIRACGRRDLIVTIKEKIESLAEGFAATSPHRSVIEEISDELAWFIYDQESIRKQKFHELASQARGSAENAKSTSFVPPAKGVSLPQGEAVYKAILARSNQINEQGNEPRD